MGTPFMGEIRIFSFNFPPKTWTFCNGALLPINQNQGLFSLLGTVYGGNGQTTFGLPNLQGRVPIHVGGGHALGEVGGEQNHTLTTPEMARHNHILQAKDADADKNVGGITAGPTKALARGLVSLTGGSTTPANIYGTGAINQSMAPGEISNVGGGQAHMNMQPYLVLNFCIALTGIFPSQN